MPKHNDDHTAFAAGDPIGSCLACVNSDCTCPCKVCRAHVARPSTPPAEREPPAPSGS